MFTNPVYMQMLGKKVVSEAKRMAPWGLPALLGGTWLIYPALTEEFKKDCGLPNEYKEV